MRARVTGATGMILEVPTAEAGAIRAALCGRSLSALATASIASPDELSPHHVERGSAKERLFLELPPALLRGVDALIVGSRFPSRASYLRACLSRFVGQPVEE